MRLAAALLAAMLCLGPAHAQAPETGTLTETQMRDLLESLTPARVYQPAGPPVVATGPIARGDRLVAMPIRHSTTGILRGDAAARSMAGQLDGMTIRAGSPVFMTRTIDGRRAWCGRAVSNDWRGNCIFVYPPTGTLSHMGVVGWSDESIYFPRTYTGSYPLAEPLPVVEEGAVDFGVTMEMIWSFDRWTRRNAEIKIEVRDSLGKRTRLQELRVPRDADGGARVTLGGGEVTLRPEGNGAIAEITQPIEWAEGG